MVRKQDSMTTAEFAKASGIPAASVSKLIRDGKLKAAKVSGRWRIDHSQLQAKAVVAYGRTAPEKPAAAPPKAPSPKKPAAAESTPPKKAFSIAEFAAMTYLTEKGVRQWLKIGRLKGQMAPNGEWSVDAANLEVADIARLVRK
jgi:excisionase family DNA binding protein